MRRPSRTLPDHPAERLVRQLREAGDKRTVQLPLTVARSQDAVTLVTFDFGRIVAGHVELEVEAPPGVRLDLFYQESADYDAVAGPVDSAPRSSASYTTRGFADHYKAVDINGLRKISLHDPAGSRRSHRPRNRGQRVPLPVHREAASTPATPS